GGATVSLTGRGGAHVQVSVHVQNADEFSCVDVTQVVSKRGLVAAAQYNRHSTGIQDCRDNFAEGPLRLFQVALEVDVAQVKRSQLGQVGPADGVPRRQAVEPLTDLARRLRGADATLVAAHSFVLRKADEDRSAGAQGSWIACPEFDALRQAR